MAEDQSNRTEEPTPKRREEARTEGRVAQSAEVGSTAVLLAAVLVLSHRGAGTVGALRETMRRSLVAVSAHDLTPGQVMALMHGLAVDCVGVVAPILGVTAMVGLTATVAQVGFRVTPTRLVPDPSKLSFANGLQRIFSKRGVVELLKAVVKIGLIGWLGWKLLLGSEPRIMGLAGSPPREILAVAGLELRRVVAWVAGMLAILAGLDYAWQRRQFQISLRMTRAEVKEEQRHAEGDPRMKKRIKRAYEQIAKGRMLVEVPTADVVVTNPVHLAVALRYRPGEMNAPVVVAKGAERVAERIKEIARRHGVPIMERRALARALFRSVPLGGEIPATLYRAVAEILAYIYGLQARRAG